MQFLPLPRLCLSLLAASGLGFIFPMPVSAAVLVSYNFSDGPNATLSAANLTGAPAAWNGFTSQYGFSNSTGTAYVFSDQTSLSFNSSQYLSITITAASGYLLDLDSFSFSLGGSNTSTVTPITFSSVLRSNIEVTPFSSDLVLTPGPVTTASHTSPAGTNPATFSSFTTDLSAAQFQGLQSITFRMYVFDSADSGTMILRMDALSLSGDVVPIPEPSAAILFGIGAGLCVYARRRSGRN